MTSKAKKHALVEEIAFVGLRARMGPVSLHFYAQDYFSAASAIASIANYSPAQLYLLCHSIELSLKAYLSLQGDRMIDMATGPGHDLERLLVDAKAKGLSALVPLALEQEDSIVKAAKYYREKVFEYPSVLESAKAYPDRPLPQALYSAARSLVDGLEAPCRNA